MRAHGGPREVVELVAADRSRGSWAKKHMAAQIDPWRRQGSRVVSWALNERYGTVQRCCVHLA